MPEKKKTPQRMVLCEAEKGLENPFLLYYDFVSLLLSQSMLWTRFLYTPRLIRLIALSFSRRLMGTLAERVLA